MKEKDIRSLEKSIEAAIVEREKKMMNLSEEISKIREEIRTLDGQIDAFDDIENASEFSRLKDARKIAGERLELLERRYREEMSGSGQDQDKRREEFAQFKAMAKDALDEFEKDAAALIAELQTKYDLADSKLSTIRSLHSGWVKAYNINGSLGTFEPKTNAQTLNRVGQILYRERFIRSGGVQ